MDKTYKVIFNIKNFEGVYKLIPGLEDAMKSELIRVYNIYADKTNSGVTERLNKEFDKLYPGYYERNKGKEWYDLLEYNRFMAAGYQRLVVDEFNKASVSPILDFFVDPEEVNFTGYLKVDRNVTIDFCLKEC